MQTIRISAVAVQQFLSGINQQLAKGKAVTIGNQQYTPADMAKILSGYVTAANATQNANVAYHDAVASQHAMAPSVLVFMRELKEYVYATYGDAPAPLAAFGLTPRKAAVVSAATKAGAAVKAAVTKEQRHPKAAPANLAANPTAVVAGGMAAPVAGK